MAGWASTLLAAAPPALPLQMGRGSLDPHLMQRAYTTNIWRYYFFTLFVASLTFGSPVHLVMSIVQMPVEPDGASEPGCTAALAGAWDGGPN